VSVPLVSVFARWGTPEHPVQLTPGAREFLSTRVGEPSDRPAAHIGDVVLDPPSLPAAARSALVSELGESFVSSERSRRLRHIGGASLIDYVRRREGGPIDAPDAVVQPATHDEVLAVLRICSQHSVAVVPFGGGTSVVGGVEPDRGEHVAVVALALDRMDDLLEVDEQSQLARVQPGLTGPVLERLLESRGLMWGHLPQSWQRATIGGYLATRSAGQASTGYGRSDDNVESLVIATPTGTVRLGRAPSSAAGPDLQQVFLGSEGTLGIITEAQLRVRRLPRYRRYEAVMFPDFERGTQAFRELSQSGLSATVMRLSDPAETSANLAMSGPTGFTADMLDRYLRLRGVDDACLAILGWEGVSDREVRARREAALGVLRRFGAVRLGDRVGATWREHRFSGPYLRDALLDDGYIVETLETATTWTGLADLHDSLAEAITSSLTGPEGSTPYVMAHVSHVYEAGASLYVTVIAQAEQDREEQWRRAKQAAGDAIAAGGATITHHHAVGVDHRPWMEAEIGPEGIAILRSVKKTVDPSGIMNPGKLLP